MRKNHTAPVVICYQVDNLPKYDALFYQQARQGMSLADTVRVPPRDAKSFKVKAGQIFRIACNEGTQVGDLNLWNANNYQERFFSGKTRQLHATHLTKGHRLWSNMPYLRYIATITHDTLDDYGYDKDGASVHDVIGTRCDPYTNYMLSEQDYHFSEQDYHYCCHSNLLRAFSQASHLSLDEAEPFIHDVFNVFMCTGFTSDTHQYFMKQSPAEKGDYLEMFAEIDLLGVLSACPGGDCSSSHSSDSAQCYSLDVEIYDVDSDILSQWSPPTRNGYNQKHGVESS